LGASLGASLGCIFDKNKIKIIIIKIKLKIKLKIKIKQEFLARRVLGVILFCFILKK
jgi:hypothetical protein